MRELPSSLRGADAEVLRAGDCSVGDCPGTRGLHARGLGLCRNGRWLFREMSWHAAPGEFLALRGPSGAGKSSLLAVLAGMLGPDHGEVVCCDGDGRGCAPAAFYPRVGVVFQDLRLVPNSSVLDNIMTGRLGRYPWWRTLFGFPRADRAESLQLAQALGLGRVRNRWAGRVSGGEQQRTAVARALFQQPTILLADEPVSNLDASLGETVLQLLRRHAAATGCTVVCALHQDDLIERHADRVLELGCGGPSGWRWA